MSDAPSMMLITPHVATRLQQSANELSLQLCWIIYFRPRNPSAAKYICLPAEIKNQRELVRLPFLLQAPTLNLLRVQLPHGLQKWRRAHRPDIIEYWI